jgi:hypothetical protein
MPTQTSPIRVAIGDVQSPLARDILVQITKLEADMQVVGHVSRPDLKAAIARQGAHALICEVRPDELPEVCRELFGEPNAPLVVGLARDGREAAVCIPNAGVVQLMSVVRSAIRGADDRGGEVGPALGTPEAARETLEPYASNADCLRDQLVCLDLAILAEVDSFQSSTWDENMQRLQGLAISPDEVRGLFQAGAPGAAPPGGELRDRRLKLSAMADRRIAATAGRPDAPPFVCLVERFGLGPFERFCVVAALAVEVDRNKYGKAYALLQDDVTRKLPSPELMLRLYAGRGDSDPWEAARSFESSGALRRWQILRLAPREAGEPATSLGRRIELDDRTAGFLLGLQDLGSPLGDFTVAGPWDADVLRLTPPASLEERLSRLVGEVLQKGKGAPPSLVLHLRGRYGTGRRSLVASICTQQGLRLLRVDAGRVASLGAAALEEAALLLARESSLQAAALCVENIDPLLEDEAPGAVAGVRAIEQLLRAFSPVSFVIGERPWSPETRFPEGAFQGVDVPLPEGREARRVWVDVLTHESLAAEAGGPERAAGELASRFRLSHGQILAAAAAARTRALWQSAEREPLTLADLYRGCREQCGQRLSSLARQVRTTFGWDDLVLPPEQRSQLRELESAIRNSSGVLQDWNFESRLPYGRGITALFSGPSGTGKTMAAGILARELGLDLYAIDLSRVVSKYIGETEKNLDRIFRQAEDASAMLLFDEADALFGKRSAIKDAHDRYANIEVAYLLQKMEERLGVTILATNLRSNLDEAFSRRIRFGIEFPMPEYAQRLQIWRGALPEAARLADDVDLPLLAKRLRVSGGSITNVCVSAASLAYAPGGAIAMRHFLHAAKREMQKLGQQYSERDFAWPGLTEVPAGRPGIAQ